jgi:hypothetical protein
MRGPHDVGGLPAGPVDTHEHLPDRLDKQVDAMMMLLAAKGISRVDEMRKNIETIGHDAYNTLPYYDKWTSALMRILVDKGVLTQDELDARVKMLRQRVKETGRIEAS